MHLKIPTNPILLKVHSLKQILRIKIENQNGHVSHSNRVRCWRQHGCQCGNKHVRRHSELVRVGGDFGGAVVGRREPSGIHHRVYAPNSPSRTHNQLATCSTMAVRLCVSVSKSIRLTPINPTVCRIVLHSMVHFTDVYWCGTSIQIKNQCIT